MQTVSLSSNSEDEGEPRANVPGSSSAQVAVSRLHQRSKQAAASSAAPRSNASRPDRRAVWTPKHWQVAASSASHAAASRPGGRQQLGVARSGADGGARSSSAQRGQVAASSASHAAASSGADGVAPTAYKGPFRYKVAPCVQRMMSYIKAREQTNMRNLIEATESMQEATPIGHNLLELLSAWQALDVAGEGRPWRYVPLVTAGGKRRRPVEVVGEYLMIKHREARQRVRDILASEEVHEPIALANVGEASVLRRRETPNWTPEGVTDARLNGAELNAILKEHDGEARVWQIGAEVWKPLLSETWENLIQASFRDSG